MKMNDIVNESQETDNAARKLAAIGRVLMDRAVTTKDDALSNTMAKFGDALTHYGTTWGPRNPQELMKKTGVSAEVLKKLLAYGESELKKGGDVAKGGAAVDDEPEDDFDSPSDDDIDAKAVAMSQGKY
jgi:hypothetical protein|tara:strand:- start:383 stop:769 length:387 start_codon:yes stop_codon:yes gene_type:complete